MELIAAVNEVEVIAPVDLSETDEENEQKKLMEEGKLAQGIEDDENDKRSAAADPGDSTKRTLTCECGSNRHFTTLRVDCSEGDKPEVIRLLREDLKIRKSDTAIRKTQAKLSELRNLAQLYISMHKEKLAMDTLDSIRAIVNEM